jgi:uncharacterized membrane protein
MAKGGKVQRRARSRKRRPYGALKLAGPFLAFFVGVGLLALAYPWARFLVIFTLMIAYMVPPAGKETMIPIGIFVWGLDWVLVSVVISFMDIVTALFFVWNFDYAKRIPVLGKWIRNFENENANIMSEKAWLRGMTYIGLVLFVFVPLQGTEGVGGSVLGRILGLRPWTVFSAIVVGSLTGSLATAYIAIKLGTAILNMLTDTTSKIIAGIVLLAAFAVISYLLWWYKKRRKAAKGRKALALEEE